jgi:hypothetical protein
LGTRSDCPKLFNKEELLHSSSFLLNGDLLVGRASQDALHDWPIGLAVECECAQIGTVALIASAAANNCCGRCVPCEGRQRF